MKNSDITVLLLRQAVETIDSGNIPALKKLFDTGPE
jgi:hypothetical protein